MQKPTDPFQVKNTEKTVFTTTSVRLPKLLLEQVQTLAEKEGESTNEVINQILRWAIDTNGGAAHQEETK